MADWSKYKRKRQTSEEAPQTGFAGVREDVKESLAGFPSALKRFALMAPFEAAASAGQLVMDPARASRNIASGAVGGVRGGLNVPGVIGEYASEKELLGGGQYSPYNMPVSENEMLQNLSKGRLGDVLNQAFGGLQENIAPAGEKPGDLFLRGAGEFTTPSGVAGRLTKPLSKLGKSGERFGKAVRPALEGSIYGVSQETDPIQAALLAKAGDLGARGVGKLAKSPAGSVAAGAGVMGAATLAGLPSTLSGGLGAGAAYLIERGLSPKAYAEKQMFKGISPLEAEAKVEAAQRLGLPYITPAEAVPSYAQGKKQGNIGKHGEASKKLSEAGEARQDRSTEIIESFLDRVYNPENLDAVKSAEYEAVKDTRIPEDTAIKMYLDDPVSMKAIKMLESDPAYKKELKGVRKDTIGYWDQVKRVLGDMESAALRKGNKDRARIIGQTRKDLVSSMDSVEPRYEKARRLAERDKAREKIERLFDKTDPEHYARKLGKELKSNKFFNELSRMLRDDPELLQDLSDMREVFPVMLEPLTAKTAEFGERQSVGKERNVLDAAKGIIAETVGTPYENALVDLMTSPDWIKKLETYKKRAHPNPAMNVLIKELNRRIPQAASISTQEPGEESE